MQLDAIRKPSFGQKFFSKTNYKYLQSNELHYSIPTALFYFMSYHRNIIHVVFATKNRKKVLTKEIRPKLFSAIGNTLKQNNCKPININGVEDHIHLLFGVHPSCSLADIIKTIKLDASSFLKQKFPTSGFDYWSEGYAAFGVSSSLMEQVYHYIENQEVHHKKVDSKTELIQLLKEHRIEYNEMFLH